MQTKSLSLIRRSLLVYFATMLFTSRESEWYRFSNATLSNYCVARYHCGTDMTLWVNSTLPTDNNQKLVQLCANLNDSCCSWSSQISVQRCPDPNTSQGYFYVYQLKKPNSMCYYGYCIDFNVLTTPAVRSTATSQLTNNLFIPSTTTTTTTTTTKSTTVSIVSSSTTISGYIYSIATNQTRLVLPLLASETSSISTTRNNLAPSSSNSTTISPSMVNTGEAEASTSKNRDSLMVISIVIPTVAAATIAIITVVIVCRKCKRKKNCENPNFTNGQEVCDAVIENDPQVVVQVVLPRNDSAPTYITLIGDDNENQQSMEPNIEDDDQGVIVPANGNEDGGGYERPKARPISGGQNNDSGNLSNDEGVYLQTNNPSIYQSLNIRPPQDQSTYTELRLEDNNGFGDYNNLYYV